MTSRKCITVFIGDNSSTLRMKMYSLLGKSHKIDVLEYRILNYCLINKKISTSNHGGSGRALRLERNITRLIFKFGSPILAKQDLNGLKKALTETKMTVFMSIS